MVFREKEDAKPKEDPVNVNLVMPIQQTVKQIKEEVKERKDDDTGKLTSSTVMELKLPKKRPLAIRQ